MCELLAKNVATKSKNTTRRTTSTIMTIWRISAGLNNSLSPKLANKQAIEDELNIDGGKHFKQEILLNECLNNY